MVAEIKRGRRLNIILQVAFAVATVMGEVFEDFTEEIN